MRFIWHIWDVFFGIQSDFIINCKFDSDIWWSEGVKAYITTRGWNSVFIDSACIGKFFEADYIML